METTNKRGKSMRILTIICLTLFSGFAVAAGSTPSQQTGTIKSIQALSDGRTIVFMVDTRTERPDCASNGYWFLVDENSTAGKTQLSMLLAAHASARNVKLLGTGQCTHWADGEDIDSVEFL